MSTTSTDTSTHRVSQDTNGNGWPGWKPMPDFTDMSNTRLDLHESMIDEYIRWAEEDGDPHLATWYGQQMRALQAERKRRVGGENSFPSPKGDIGKATNFRPVPASELLNQQTVSIPWVLDGYIPKGVLALLIAYMKTGKSTLVYRLIVCIAQGLEFLGRKTEPGSVLILAVEEHQRDIEIRVLDDGLTQVRRKDRLPTTAADLEEARKLADSLPGITVDDVLRVFPGAKVIRR